MLDFASDHAIVAHATTLPNVVQRHFSNISTHALGKFLSHPGDFPIEVRTAISWKSWFGFARVAVDTEVGLRFFSGIPYKLGSNIRITIPLRHKNNRFEGRVIHVNSLRVGYEVNAIMLSCEDGERLRIVERICALECELQRSLPAFNS